MAGTAIMIGTPDDYLTRVCEAIQLRETQYNTAEKRYLAVGAYLTATDTLIEPLGPTVFPQGSMLQRTTIRPYREGEEIVPFDLDCVCLCRFDPFQKTSQSLYMTLRTNLTADAKYQDRLNRAKDQFGSSGKVLRLAYNEDDFHLDVVPACKDPEDPEGLRIYLCNPSRWNGHKRPIETWKRSDPIRFAKWLDQRCNIGRKSLNLRGSGSVADVPEQEHSNNKAPLRRVIQLLKRQRDVYFLGDASRPSSILLSTLAATHYRGEESIGDALESILVATKGQIERASGKRIQVLNPADQSLLHGGGIEDLVSTLDDAAYQKFCRMIDDMLSDLRRLRRPSAPGDALNALVRIAGQKAASVASSSLQTSVQEASRSGVLGIGAVDPKLHVLSRPQVHSNAQPVRPNNFHTRT